MSIECIEGNTSMSDANMPRQNTEALFDSFQEKDLGEFSIWNTAHFYISKRSWPVSELLHAL